MANLVAIWGAATGTAGLSIALRREFASSRRRLAVAPGVNFTLSRARPPGVRQGWALVKAYNSGGRAIAIERVGFRYWAKQGGDLPADVREVADDLYLERRAEIHIGDPIPLAVDGPSRTIYTPLGPMLAAGISAVAPLEAFAITTGGRWWSSPAQPLVQAPPPGLTLAELLDELQALREVAEPPPEIDGLVWLAREEPQLPET